MHNELHTAIAVDAFIAYRTHNQDLRIIKSILEYKYGIYAKMYQVDKFVNSPYKPEKGLLIKELFKLGYTTEKIAEWTGASKANISYHKLNDKEYDYFDKGLNLLIHNPYGNITKDE